MEISSRLEAWHDGLSSVETSALRLFRAGDSLSNELFEQIFDRSNSSRVEELVLAHFPHIHDEFQELHDSFIDWRGGILNHPDTSTEVINEKYLRYNAVSGSFSGTVLAQLILLAEQRAAQ